MTALSIIISIVLILVSIVLIAAVLMQQGQRQGLGAIGGGAETFLGKNAASTLEGKLKTITKIAAVVFIVLAIAATMITAHINNSEADAALQAALESGEAHIHEDGSVHYGEHVEETETTEGETAETETTETEATEAPAEATEAPTAEPTEAPTAEPTAAPTEAPTAEPTAEATEAPTAAPAA